MIQLSVVSCQLSVVSCQLSVVSCQVSVVRPRRWADRRSPGHAPPTRAACRENRKLDSTPRIPLSRALPTFPVLARTVSAFLNPAFLGLCLEIVRFICPLCGCATQGAAYTFCPRSDRFRPPELRCSGFSRQPTDHIDRIYVQYMDTQLKAQ